MLAGVGELCAGLASAVGSGGADPALLGDLLPAGSLTALLAACPTPAASRAVMSIATALPFLPGSQDVRIRSVAVDLAFHLHVRDQVAVRSWLRCLLWMHPLSAMVIVCMLPKLRHAVLFMSDTGC